LRLVALQPPLADVRPQGRFAARIRGNRRRPILGEYQTVSPALFRMCAEKQGIANS
jgi:hypothetical protein